MCTWGEAVQYQRGLFLHLDDVEWLFATLLHFAKIIKESHSSIKHETSTSTMPNRLHRATRDFYILLNLIWSSPDIPSIDSASMPLPVTTTCHRRTFHRVVSRHSHTCARIHTHPHTYTPTYIYTWNGWLIRTRDTLFFIRLKRNFFIYTPLQLHIPMWFEMIQMKLSVDMRWCKNIVSIPIAFFSIKYISSMCKKNDASQKLR